MRGETPAPSPLTLSELVEEYLAQHVAEQNTIRALSDRLKLATDGIPVKPRSSSASTVSEPSASTAWTRARSAPDGCRRDLPGTLTRRYDMCSRTPCGRS
jgi:hypothetical protein